MYAKNLDQSVAWFNVIYFICEFFFFGGGGHFERVIDYGLLRPHCLYGCVCRKIWSCFVRYIDCLSDWFVLPPECGGVERNYLEL